MEAVSLKSQADVLSAQRLMADYCKELFMQNDREKLQLHLCEFENNSIKRWENKGCSINYQERGGIAGRVEGKKF